MVFDSWPVKQILAGAGCGKTFTIIQALLFYFRKGLRPHQFLLVTFTRKAATEMRTRLEAGLGQMTAPVFTADRSAARTHLEGAFIGTFHSLAWRILREYFPQQVAGCQIMDELEAGRLKARVVKDCSRLRGASVSLLFSDQPLPPEWEPVREQARQVYRQRKRDTGRLDYDDLLEKLIQVLEDPENARRLRERFGLVLVDEFQDSGRLEMEFLRRLKPRRLICVGDIRQSIYGFRRADISYSRDFKKYFPRAREYPLSLNYRSSPQILRTGAGVLEPVPQMPAAPLRAHRPAGPKPLYFAVPHPERVWLGGILFLRELWREPGIREAGGVILCRTNHQARKWNLWVEEKLSEWYAPLWQSKRWQAMTIHQAKGLEFHTVLISPFQEGSLPHPRGEPGEEARLLYVACTRAIHYLAFIGCPYPRAGEFQDSVAATSRVIKLLDVHRLPHVLAQSWGISSVG